MIELIILIVLAIFALSYRQNNGENVYRFFVTQTKNIYDKYAPYSFKSVSAKVKELGQDYSVKDYVFQGVKSVLAI